MASAPKFVRVLVILLFCLLLLQQHPSECNRGHGCSFAKAAGQDIHNRKVVYPLRGKEMVFKSSSSTTGYGESMEEDSELRKVPSGPDPLHHNGGSPKKPRTP